MASIIEVKKHPPIKITDEWKKGAASPIEYQTLIEQMVKAGMLKPTKDKSYAFVDAILNVGKKDLISSEASIRDLTTLASYLKKFTAWKSQPVGRQRVTDIILQVGPQQITHTELAHILRHNIVAEVKKIKSSTPQPEDKQIQTPATPSNTPKGSPVQRNIEKAIMKDDITQITNLEQQNEEEEEDNGMQPINIEDLKKDTDENVSKRSKGVT